MKNPNTIEAELDAIRDKIYEEIKDMTPEEETAYFQRETADVITQYGLKLVKPAVALNTCGVARYYRKSVGSWTSSNTEIATVSETGVVTAVAAGSPD
jgi:hypothetical protein